MELLEALDDAGARSAWGYLDPATQYRWEKFVAAAVPVYSSQRAADAAAWIIRGRPPLRWPGRALYACKESGLAGFPPSSPGSGLSGAP